MSEGLLIKQEKYLEAGIHIGTKLRTLDMAKFIYRTRSDGLYVLDLRQVDERIKYTAKVLSKYNPEDIVIIAGRTYSAMAARAFSKITGITVMTGRFVPGAFTNVTRNDFCEPKLVVICDPKGERQAVVECGNMGVTTIGLCDTDNITMYIDWVVPCNNKGRRSLALIFWLFARELAMNSSKISAYDEFEPSFEDFEALITQLDEEKDKTEEEAKHSKKKGKKNEEEVVTENKDETETNEKEDPVKENKKAEKPAIKKETKPEKKTAEKEVTNTSKKETKKEVKPEKKITHTSKKETKPEKKTAEKPSEKKK